MDVYLDHLSYALGDQAFPVEESAAAGRTLSKADMLRDAGFRTHYLCRPETNSYDLARRAVEPIKDRLGDIGAIVYATCLPQNANIGELSRYRETRDVKHLLDSPAS